MRHAKPYRKLSRQRSHYRALMRNLALALFEHERIQTTIPKAKEVRRFVDKIVTLAKKGTLHDRRTASALLGNITKTEGGKRVDILGKVFKEIAPRVAKINGGFTRIIRIGTRAGDAAEMAILELVSAQPKATKPKKGKDEEAVAAPAAETTEKKAKAPKAAAKKKKEAAA